MSHLSTNRARSMRPRGRWPVALLVLTALFAFRTAAQAQLSGTYTVGGSGSTYSSIENAISALQSSGVSGSVTFLIAGGTYTPPTGGYTLPAVSTMSSTNTVTFRPASGAVVVVDGSMSTAIFTIDNGDYYILNGSNSSGSDRNWKVINRGSGQAVKFINGATYNTVKNMNLIANNTTSTIGVVNFNTTSAGGNSYNLVSSNTIGDSTGTLRSLTGIYCTGTAGSSTTNTANRIENNDIINFGNGTSTAYGIWTTAGNQQVKILGNRIRIPVKSGAGGGVDGIRFDNSSDSYLDTIGYNRIWDITTTSTSPTINGINDYYQTASSSLTIHNNMISVISNAGTITAVQLWPTASSTTTYMYYNSLYVGGANPSASTTSYVLRIYGGTSLTLQNNILVNTRTSTGTNTNRVIYRASASDALGSDYNLLYAAGASTAYGYDGSTNRTSLADWQSTGKDPNSVGGQPRFINPGGGDLHIATNQRTAVESHGTPISGITTDFDGSTRSTTTPDIGADEGTFLPVLTHDVEALALSTPATGATVRAGSSFTPTGIVANAGTSSESSIPVHYRIVDLSTNTTVYEDVQTSGTIATTGAQQTITFGTSGSVTGSSTLSTNGTYRILLWTQLGTDGDHNNDTMSGTITVKSPLAGTYTIDKNGSGPTNYTSFTAAANDLSQLGVSAAVTFRIATGTYDGTTETFPITLGAISGSSSTSTVTFVPMSGAVVSIDGGGAQIIDINGADYLTLNGSNSGGSDRNWKVINRGGGQAVRFINGATYNTVKNMNLIGSGSTNGIGVILFSTSTSAAGGNSYNVLSSNTIGDSTGTIRSVTGIYMNGTTGSSTTNTANRIENNDLINFGYGTTAAYGIWNTAGNQMVKILGNRIRIPVKTGASGNVDAIRFDNGSDSNLDTIAYNKVWDISSSSSTATLIGINDYYQASSSSLVIHSNAIAVIADAGTLTGVQLWPSSTGTSTYMYYNSLYVSGSNSGSSTSSYTLRIYGGTSLTAENNVIVNTRTSTGSNSNIALYRASSSDALTSDYNLLYAGGSSTVLAYDGSNYRTPLTDWQSTGKDANSASAAVTFINASTGDFHIDPVRVFLGESRATPIAGISTDLDGDSRDATHPDMGADEGNFNGAGITVVSPNGGESYAVNYQLVVNYTINRPLNIRVELSTDGGATWTPKGSATGTSVGANSITITTPDVVTSQALVRVISQLNTNESDTSNTTFSLVRPVLTILSPNGGESWTGGDTNQIRWTTDFMPPTMPSDLQYSIDGGTTWIPIRSNMLPMNLPATNSLAWVVPDAPTNRALVRVIIPNSTNGDTSNTAFTIVRQPSVTLLSPTAGDRWFVGDRNTIRWTTTTTDFVTLDYSTDGGTSWTEIAHHVPAYVNSLDWTVPNTPSTAVIVRVTSYERPRYHAESGTMSIVRPKITVLSPNGGEKYELNEQVTVTWSSEASTRVRVEYSADNGATWKVVASGVPAAAGTTSFTPPAIPTKNALVRITDEDRPTATDVSDAPFKVMEAVSITLFSPATGDQYARNAVTAITWSAPRIQAVNILYSPNGGSSWQTIASNVAAAQGSFIWNVPNANTTSGKIRIVDVASSLAAESGLFSIVDPVEPTLRVIAPNGGESYTTGDNVTILWSASNIADRLAISYSTNSGASWTSIATNVLPTLGQYAWTAPGTAGTRYRVKIASALASDMSDADFTVQRRLSPALMVVSPNGGESFTVGSRQTISWTAQDVFGTFAVAYSTDNGGTWIDVTTSQANPTGNGTYSYDWTVPNTVTAQALVRVSAPGLSDVSDAVFEIKAKPLDPITVLTPNGGEVLQPNTPYMITFSAPADVVNIKIDLSRDGGQSWEPVIAAVPAASGSYNWITPVPMTTIDKTALIRVSDVADATRKDESDAPFSIKAPSSGVDVTTGGSATLSLLGNFPNPFAASTEIRWTQATGAGVTLRIFNADGALVDVIPVGRREAGRQQFTLDGSGLTSGVYHFELIVGDDAVRGSMMVVR